MYQKMDIIVNIRGKVYPCGLKLNTLYKIVQLNKSLLVWTVFGYFWVYQNEHIFYKQQIFQTMLFSSHIYKKVTFVQGTVLSWIPFYETVRVLQYEMSLSDVNNVPYFPAYCTTQLIALWGSIQECDIRFLYFTRVSKQKKLDWEWEVLGHILCNKSVF